MIKTYHQTFFINVSISLYINLSIYVHNVLFKKNDKITQFKKHLKF